MPRKHKYKETPDNPQLRTLRLADGPDEVHSNQIGRLELAQQLATS